MWELLTIVKKGDIGKATAIEDIFEQPISEMSNNRAYTWTNTPAPNTHHWTIRFNYGGIDVYDENGAQGELVRCVSGAATKIALAPIDRSFSRDTLGIVTEAKSNLQWSDDKAGPKLTWEEAIVYCEGMTLGGYDDWRLPNINEWYTLSTYSNSTDQYPVVFVNIVHGEKYWSSTTIEFQPLYDTTTVFNTGQAWLYKPSAGADSVSSPDKAGQRYTMCVRNQ